MVSLVGLVRDMGYALTIKLDESSAQMFRWIVKKVSVLKMCLKWSAITDQTVLLSLR